MNHSASNDYHSSQHWDRVHAGEGRALNSLAAGALHASVGATIDQRVTGGRGRLLELACGRGQLLRGLSSDFVRIGADFSAAALRSAQEAQAGDACAWIQADAVRLPLTTASIDVAVCLSSLWVFARPERCIGECARIIKRNGIAIVHLWGPPRECRLITLGAALLARALPELERPGQVTGPFELTTAGVGRWLSDAGFASVEWLRFVHHGAAADAAAYWAEFADLAETAYAAYRRLPSAPRCRIDEALEALLGQCRQRTGSDTLPLSWWLGVATR